MYYRAKNEETQILMEVILEVDKKIWRKNQKMIKKKTGYQQNDEWRKQIMQEIMDFREKIENKLK